MLSSSFAEYVSTHGMWERALVVRAFALIGKIRTLEHMTLVTVVVRAIAETCKRSTDRGRGGDVDMGITACIIGAVAAQEVNARRHAVDRHDVAEVTIFASGALALEECGTDGDFRRVVGEAA